MKFQTKLQLNFKASDFRIRKVSRPHFTSNIPTRLIFGSIRFHYLSTKLAFSDCINQSENLEKVPQLQYTKYAEYRIVENLQPKCFPKRECLKNNSYFKD